MKYLTILLTASLCCLSIAVFSQNNPSQNWEKQIELQGLEISIQKTNCQDPSRGISKEYLFLKISNTNSKPLKLDYKIEKWYDGVCSNCNESESENGIYSINIAAEEKISGSCEDYRNRNLAVFSKMTGNAKARQLTNFKIIPLSLNGKKL